MTNVCKYGGGRRCSKSFLKILLGNSFTCGAAVSAEKGSGRKGLSRGGLNKPSVFLCKSYLMQTGTSFLFCTLFLPYHIPPHFLFPESGEEGAQYVFEPICDCDFIRPQRVEKYYHFLMG